MVVARGRLLPDVGVVLAPVGPSVGKDQLDLGRIPRDVCSRNDKALAVVKVDDVGVKAGVGVVDQVVGSA